MAQYTVQAPDGKMITLEGPDGASDEEVIKQAQLLYSQEQSQAPSAPMAPGMPEPGTGEKLAAGAISAANSAAFGLPAAVMGKINPKYAESFREMQERNPEFTTGGEILGMLSPAGVGAKLGWKGAELGGEAVVKMYEKFFKATEKIKNATTPKQLEAAKKEADSIMNFLERKGKIAAKYGLGAVPGAQLGVAGTSAIQGGDPVASSYLTGQAMTAPLNLIPGAGIPVSNFVTGIVPGAIGIGTQLFAP